MNRPSTEQSYLLSLAASAGDLVDTALATSTRRRYQAAWKRYQNWCRLHGLVQSAPSAKTIGLFLTERSRTVGMSALTQDLSAIRHHLRLAGCAVRDDRELLARLLKGCRRAKKNINRPKRKIQPDTLLQALKLIPETLKGRRDRAMLLTGFASAMRRSELVCLEWSNIRFEEEGFCITTGWSKSGKAIDGCFVPRVSSPLCAWSVLSALHVELSDSSPFCFPRIAAHAPTMQHVSDRYLYRLIKHLMGKLGAPQEEYGAHSLRRGFITAAHHAGVTNGDILNVTHHRTERGLLPYIAGVDGNAYRKVIASLGAGFDQDERD